MDIQESFRTGLRVEGSEKTPEGIRHRRRYHWAGARVRELVEGSNGNPPLAAAKIVDHGCGTGYGCRIIWEALGAPKKIDDALVWGYDSDEEAVKYAQRHWWPECYTDESICERRPERPLIIVSMGVLEHIPEMHPRDHLAHFFDEFKADAVVGFVPYREKKGPNPHHCWHGLDERILPAGASIYYEPMLLIGTDDRTDQITRVRRGAFFETGFSEDAINMLFVLTRATS